MPAQGCGAGFGACDAELVFTFRGLDPFGAGMSARIPSNIGALIFTYTIFFGGGVQFIVMVQWIPKRYSKY